MINSCEKCKDKCCNSVTDKKFYVDVMLTHMCNFSCSYCYEHGLEKKQEDIVKISDNNVDIIILHIKKLIKKDEYSNIVVNFWGGEPTLACDKMSYIVEKLKKYKQVSFTVFTNGYDIRELVEIANNIDNSRFEIQVSYDFYLQDRNRLCNKDKDSSHKVKDNLVFLLKNGFNVVCKSTISMKDLPELHNVYYDYIQFKRFLDDNKIHNRLALTLTIDTEYKYNTKLEFTDLLNKTEESLKKVMIHKLNNVKSSNSCGEYIFNWFMSDCNKCCNIGHDFICIDIDGNIYPCHGAIFSSNKRDHILGNMFEGRLLSTYSIPYYNLSSSIDDYNNECQECFSTVCFRCNVHNYDKVKKEDSKLSYIEELYNFSKDVNCDIYKLISKYQIALSTILSKRKEI